MNKDEDWINEAMKEYIEEDTKGFSRWDSKMTAATTAATAAPTGKLRTEDLLAIIRSMEGSLGGTTVATMGAAESMEAFSKAMSPPLYGGAPKKVSTFKANEYLPKIVEDAVDGYLNEYNNIFDTTLSPVFTLPGPTVLTVKKKDATYAKKAHIGGEEFTLHKVYAGKLKGAIGVFLPRAATAHVWVEIPLVQASTLFGRTLEEHLIACAKQIKIPQKEVATGMPDVLDEESAKNYDDFGSW